MAAVLATPASAQVGSQTVPLRDTKAGVTAAPALPPAPEPAQAAPAPVAAADRWSPEEIASARARCTAILKTVQAEFEHEEPWRDGECGTPAPVKLSRINGVALAPPSTLTCEMVAALGTWVKSDLQPLARKHLGTPVASLNVMSSYSCRAAYGRVGGRLSEHGKANALDIGGFVTAKGETTSVLTAWGPTARDVKAELAKAEADRRRAEEKAQKDAHQRALDQAKALRNQMAQQRQGGAAAPVQTGTIAPATRDPGPAVGLQPALQHLGGPKADAPVAAGTPPRPVAIPAGKGSAKPDVPAAVPDVMELEIKRMQFMRELHAASCRTFGTVLGPEANAFHANHFHLDMAERKMARSICE